MLTACFELIQKPYSLSFSRGILAESDFRRKSLIARKSKPAGNSCTLFDRDLYERRPFHHPHRPAPQVRWKHR